MNTEGILFGDIFVNNKELFIEMFTEYYRSNSFMINKAIQNLNGVLQKFNTKVITKESANEFNAAWQSFQNIVLLNMKDLQLIVSYRSGKDGISSSFSEILNQSTVENSGNFNNNLSYGIETGNNLVRESIQHVKASEVEQFLQGHINGFLKQLNAPINKDESKNLHKWHQHFLQSDYQKKGIHLTGLPWRQPFYGGNAGSYFSGKGLGKAYDAFMNHLANFNKQIYSYLETSGTHDTLPDTIREHSSVFVEEGGAERYSTFPRLLKDSRNNVSWYSGGDIVIVDPEDMSIVYNIQLKTTGINAQSTFGVAVAKLRTFIAQLEQANDSREQAKILYKNLLTSISNRNDFNKLPQETVDRIIKESLGKVLKNF